MSRRPTAAIWTAVLMAAASGLVIEIRSQQDEDPPPREQGGGGGAAAAGRLLVPMTIVHGAASIGAVCLDGSSPAYHLDRGSGGGAGDWLLQFEGGGWCEGVSSCMERSTTRRGSTRYMNRVEVFSGILSNDPTMNRDFYNCNRVKIRYCDGASFGGDSVYHIGNTTLYFRGYKIFEAIVHDLLPKGLISARKVLLSGCSAGGLATFIHCDHLRQLLPNAAVLKCLSDAGFFLDAKDVAGSDHIRPFFNGVVSLQEVQRNLNQVCVSARKTPYECFFPQYSLPYITTPYFILNTAYDTYQINHILVPPSSDPNGDWKSCKSNPADCSPYQLSLLQGFKDQMLAALEPIESSSGGGGGFFVDSCFGHCQSELQETWFAPNSPRLHGKTIAESVGDWFFDRSPAAKENVDGSNPCNPARRDATATTSEPFSHTAAKVLPISRYIFFFLCIYTLYVII